MEALYCPIIKANCLQKGCAMYDEGFRQCGIFGAVRDYVRGCMCGDEYSKIADALSEIAANLPQR